MKTLTLTLLILVSATSAAFANCTYNGSSYPTGSQVGGLTCTADGTWR